MASDDTSPASEAWRKTKAMCYEFVVIGGIVYIPATFFVVGVVIKMLFGPLAAVLLTPVLMAGLAFVLNYWFERFGADNPEPMVP